MASDFLNHRRCSSHTTARYGQLVRPDADPLTVRQPAGKSAKSATQGAGSLSAGPAAGAGGRFVVLGLVAIVVVGGLGLALMLWPRSEADVRQAETSAKARGASAPKALDQAGPALTSKLDVPSNRPNETSPTPPAEDVTQLLASADEHAIARRWRNAATDLTAAVSASPEDHWQWFRAATLLAWTQDQAAYRQHCAQMLQRFNQPAEPYIAERVAKSCLLLPAGVDDLKRAIRLADQAAAATEHPYHAFFLMARGLAHYRAGEFEKAVERANQSVSPDSTAIGLNVPAHLIVAMSQHRLGQKDQARQALDRAREIMSQDSFPKLESGPLGQTSWHDWLICQTLHREAEALIEGKKTP